MDATSSLSDLLERRYGVRPLTLRLLATTPPKWTYRVDQANGLPLLLRIYSADGNRDTLVNQVTILAFLEQQAYPAERIVRAVDGSSVVALQGWQVLVTTLVEGEAADLSLPSLYSLGLALGRLHALDPDTATGEKLPLPRAGMLPATEIRWAFSQLTAVERRVPRHLRARYDELVSALRGVRHCDDLPTLVIHNDCHPGNSIRTPEGRVVLIDWEGAGLGPAVLDVGFLLISSEIPYLSRSPLGSNLDRLAAVIDGYSQYHLLTPSELDRLPDAIRFRSIVAGACSFARSVSEGRATEEDSAWWWTRYLAAEQVSDRARRQFESLG